MPETILPKEVTEYYEVRETIGSGECMIKRVVSVCNLLGCGDLNTGKTGTKTALCFEVSLPNGRTVFIYIEVVVH